MASTAQQDIQQAVNALKQGQLIAYPTEAVFGLGCDPQQAQAVEQLVKLKQRNPDKGLILIASSFKQLKPYIAQVDDCIAAPARQSWPGPVTWLWPVKQNYPFSHLLTGKHATIAVRVSAHPLVKKLCDKFEGAIVSTSANIEGQPPATTAEQVRQYFPKGVDKIIEADTGDLPQPTSIYDLLTQEKLR